MQSQLTSPSSPGAGAQSPRLCVFTALLGGYETLNEQPTAAGSDIPFICLTDDADLQSDSWQVRLVSPLFGMDPARSQRDFKFRPHVHLMDFDYSLYIDNSIVLTRPPEEVFARYSPSSGFCLVQHSFRESVLDEFLEVARRALDDQSRIFEQLNHYAVDYPEVLKERPYCGGIMVRDHNNPAVRHVCEVWAAHVNRYSRRDQLSANVAFRQSGFVPEVMDIDIRSSWFHSWPHDAGRIGDDVTRTRAASFGPAVAHIRQLELALAEQVRDREAELEAVLSSSTWCLAVRLQGLAAKHPRVMSLLRRCTKAAGR